MTITNASEVQAWIDSYAFVDNGTASKDILYHIVRNLPNHQFKYGPDGNSNYVLEIVGPVITADFVVSPSI